MTEWVCGEFMFTCLTAITRAATLSAFTQRRLFAHGDAASNTNQDANMAPAVETDWNDESASLVSDLVLDYARDARPDANHLE